MRKLAVLLPTYNAALYLRDSIESVLSQTFTDFDLYIYDDCSTDNTQEVILSYNDSRLYYRKSLENLGIAKTLNWGLEELLPFYKYIARMDADDWCYPERFQKQLDFLDKNKEIVICGTQGYWLKDWIESPILGWEYPIKHEYIKCYLLFGATFGHSSVVLRADSFQRNIFRYDETIETCEDWDLWIRIAKIEQVANLPDFLMKYRILGDSNHRSPQRIKKHFEERSKIISRYWLDFNISLSKEQIFDFYYNDERISKKQYIRNSKILIQAFNDFYKDNSRRLNSEEQRNFRYLLARRILNYWKRSKVSRMDPLLWGILVKEVKFISRFKFVKSIIR